MDKESLILLLLVQSAVWNDPVDRSLFENVDWMSVYRLAEKQGVLAIAFDGIQNLPHELLPDMNTLMEWLGQTEYMVTQYEEYKKVIGHLAHFYNEQGVKMMVLKGYGLSKNYPIPNHRPIGDIDTFLFEEGLECKDCKESKESLSVHSIHSKHSLPLYQYADELIHEKLGIEIDNSHHHHTVFTFEGISVENHYDFLNVHSKKSNAEWEKVLKSLVQDGKEMRDEELENVYYPCPNFNALFVVRHSAGNFCATGLILRQVLDWLLFVRKYHDQVDWNFVYGIYRRFNFDRYVNSLNAIGLKYLDFEKSLFHELEKDENLVDRIIEDMLSPEYKGKEDGSLLGGIWVKSTRWWHNRWKHRITTPESLWSVLTYGIHSKLMKPAHLKQ